MCQSHRAARLQSHWFLIPVSPGRHPGPTVLHVNCISTWFPYAWYVSLKAEAHSAIFHGTTRIWVYSRFVKYLLALVHRL